MFNFLPWIKGVIATLIVGPTIWALSTLGFNLEPLKTVDQTPFAQNLGASNQIPDTVALFSTSLQNTLTASGTTMTLVSGAYNKGLNTLASSTYAFIIDEGTSIEEMVIADCTNTSCTNLQRGVDRLTGTTSVYSLIFQHDRGASVKITDGPVLLIHNRLLQGIDKFRNTLKYDSSISTSSLNTDRNALATVGLLQDTAFITGGIVNATEAVKGVIELATQIEMASSTTSGGTGANLVLQAKNATSTYNAATAGLRAVITQNNGKIDPNFLNLNPYPSNINITGTSNIASSTIYASTTSGTWVKPANLRYLVVEIVGGGGGGGGTTDTVRNGGSGGGGGYCKKVIPTAALGATEILTIGAGGTGGTGGSAGTAGGNSSFGSHCTANGGTAGGAEAIRQSGVAGGSATGGDINLTGGSSGPGYFSGTSADIIVISGKGGDSMFGTGGASAYAQDASGSNGNAGINYGAGGSGSASDMTPDLTGGNGTGGIAIFTYYFY